MFAGIKKALRTTGALDLICLATGSGRVDIMLYHGFCRGAARDTSHPKFMPIDEFEEQIRLFTRYRRPLQLEDLPRGTQEGIAVTFDDGYANNYHLAFPILQKYQFPACVLVATGFVDRKVPLWGDWLDFLVHGAARRYSVFEWRDERIALDLRSPLNLGTVIRQLKGRLNSMPIAEIHGFLRDLEAHLQVAYDWGQVPEPLLPLRWDDIRAMRCSGLVSFGAHTVSHPVLAACPEFVQRSELVDSKLRLEKELRESCKIFAYPYGKYGDYTERTTQFVKEAGYQVALSAESGCNGATSDWHQLRRWGADIAADDLAFLVAGGPVLSRYLRHHTR